MKSKTSFFNRAVFKRNCTGYAGLWAGMLIIQLIIGPLQVYSRLSSRWLQEMTAAVRYNYKVDQMVESIWQMHVYVPMYAIMAVVTAMFVFSYLFTSRNANMMHTFPVDRNSLFVTNYLSGALFLIGPQAIGAVLALFTGAMQGVAEPEVVRVYLIWIGVSAAELLFFFSMAVCVLMFVGNIVAVPVFYFILNFLYMGCGIIISGMISTVCYGLSSADAFYGNGMFTPIWYMRRHILVESIGQDDHWIYVFSGGKELAAYLAVTVVFVAIAVVAYKKKHVETAGDIITVGWLKPIFRWGAAICSSTLGALFLSAGMGYSSFYTILAAGAILGILVFFIAQMLLERSVRVFTKKRVQEGVVFAMCISCIYIGLDADILGLEKKVPKTEEIAAVAIANSVSIYAGTPEDIDWVRSIHEQIISSKKEFEQAERSFDTNMSYLSFSYWLKNGKRVQRSYSVPIQQGDQSVYARVSARANELDTICKQYFGIHYPDIEVYGGQFEPYGGAGQRITEAHVQAIYKAILQDMQAGRFNIEREDTGEDIGYLDLDIHDEKGFITPDNVYYSGASIVSERADNGQTEIYLDSSMEHTMEALEKLGYLTEEDKEQEG